MNSSPVLRTRVSGKAIAIALGTLVIVLGARFGAPWLGEALGSPALLPSDAGPYLIGLQPGEAADRIVAIGEGGTGAAIEVAVLPHLPGFSARGAVSPDGRYLAAVVATSGTAAQPSAELLLVDLWNGRVRSLLGGLPYLQDPVWANDSRSVAVTREPFLGTVEVIRVGLGGGQTLLVERDGVLGIYPVGFAPDGTLYSVLLDARGSTLLRGAEEVRLLTGGLTRDWTLSPDGRELAFVALEGGKYLGRVVPVEPGVAAAQAAAFADGRQRLAPVWDPATGRVLFAEEPAAGGGAFAQSTGGIDRPLAYAPDGSALAVEHWDGSSFAAPGRPEVQVIRGGERLPVAVTRVFGWSAP
ncbi:hypothetical protein HRbin29_00209 [bacterium HR29]|jgi:hypothetical protein|nr:hypothetical protein HRbin29_00209 [bacterium HR29]